MEISLTVDGAAFDATGATVQLRWTKPDGTSATVSLTTVDAATGSFQRDWVSGDTDQVGEHRGQVVVTSGGRARTFPNRRVPFVWIVVPAI